jgi:hypothetical protein
MILDHEWRSFPAVHEDVKNVNYSFETRKEYLLLKYNSF